MIKINKTSVGITSYNRPKLLSRTLASIYYAGLDVQIFISDDNSPSEILTVIDYWNQFFLREIKYVIQTKNIGEVRNKIDLFNNINSEFIVLIGDDDLIIAETFRNELITIEKKESNADVFFFGYDVIDGNDKIIRSRRTLFDCGSYYTSRFQKNIVNRFVTFPFYYFHPALYIVRTETARDLSLDDSVGIGEDYDLLFRIFRYRKDVKWIISHKKLFQWRKHNLESKNQSSNIYNRMRTKVLIWEKFNKCEISLNYFFFVYVGLFFDGGEYLTQSELSSLGIPKYFGYVLKLRRYWILRILSDSLFKVFKSLEYVVFHL